MYQLTTNPFSKEVNGVKRLTDNALIPFDPANTDYQTFKREVAAGTPLEDPDGNIMSQEQVDAFLATIP